MLKPGKSEKQADQVISASVVFLSKITPNRERKFLCPELNANVSVLTVTGANPLKLSRYIIFHIG